MTIKQQGGVFGRNPTFNDLTVEGTVSVPANSISGNAIDGGSADLDGLTVNGDFEVSSNLPKITFTEEDDGTRTELTQNFGYFTINADAGDQQAGDGIIFKVDNAEAARFTSNLNFTVGPISEIARLTVQAASSDEAGYFRPNVIDSGSGAEPVTVKVVSQKAECLDLTRYYTFGTIVQFRQNNDPVGSISVTSTATTYNTSSDYRLKEDVQSVTGAVDRLKQLNPVNFAWKADGSRVDGFLAHEAATVVPEAVTGTKDEERDIGDITDAEGNVVKTGVPETSLPDGHTWTKTGTEPVYQGIDQSKLVPLLVAALQEAMARIEALENA